MAKLPTPSRVARPAPRRSYGSEQRVTGDVPLDLRRAVRLSKQDITRDLAAHGAGFFSEDSDLALSERMQGRGNDVAVERPSTLAIDDVREALHTTEALLEQLSDATARYRAPLPPQEVPETATSPSPRGRSGLLEDLAALRAHVERVNGRVHELLTSLEG